MVFCVILLVFAYFRAPAKTLRMQIWPAIDIRGGKCVRLQQGDYMRETVFGDDPVAMAGKWVDDGAERLHLVDLDGARDGQLVNLDAVSAIVAKVKVPCEIGGGIRDEASIRSLLDVGLERLVVGTKALKEPDWFRDMVTQFPNQLVLGIDARNGQVATDGWLETSQTSATELAGRFDSLPIASIVYTDIAKDGMLSGPNIEAMAAMKRSVKHAVVASGGVSSGQDVMDLARAGLDGVIVGRALYEGRVTLPELLAAASER